MVGLYSLACAPMQAKERTADISLSLHSLFSLIEEQKAATLADSSPVAVPLPLRVEPKPKSGIRQQDLLKNIVEIRPKRHRVSSPSDGNQPTIISSARASMNQESKPNPGKELPPSRPNEVAENKAENPLTSLLGLTYESSEDDED